MTPDEVRNIRSELEMTQQELAAVMGCHKMVVSRWECATHTPPRTAVVMLAALRLLHRHKMLPTLIADVRGRREEAARAAA